MNKLIELDFIIYYLHVTYKTKPFLFDHVKIHYA